MTSKGQIPGKTSPNQGSIPGRERALAGVWFLLAILLGLAALLFNQTLVSWGLQPWGGPLPRTLARIADSRLWLAGGAIFFLGGALLFVRTGFFGWAARKEFRSNLLLALTVLTAAIFGLEQLLAARYYREPDRSTSIFVRDQELGWRLNPGSRDLWGGTMATINSQGLRGAELPAIVDGVDQYRMLFLGDSVTFGYRVADHAPFPVLVGEILGHSLPDQLVVPLNSGVGGYSPWQEHQYLVRYGEQLDPDLVLVCFVLNDITEKFSLVQFGGGEIGFQLRHTVENLNDRLARWSSIFAFGSYLRDRNRFGSDPAESARGIERLRVMDLLYDEKKEMTDMAWEVTLANLDRIFQRCEQKNLPSLLVVLPYAFQLSQPRAYGRPQRQLIEFARNRGIHCLDLLPPMAEDMRARGLAIPHYFLDDNHLTTAGHQVVAHLLAGEINRLRLTPAPVAGNPHSKH